MSVRSRRFALGLIVAITIGLAACSSSSGSAGSSGSPGGSVTTTAAGGVDPNAPEQSPPGDIPDNQVFVPYQFPDGSFTISVPEGWSRSVDGATVTFTDKLNSIRLETAPADAAPTVASAKASELPTIERLPGYTAGTVEMVDRKAGPAVRITYQATSTPDPVTSKTITLDVERYEFFTNGTEVTATLSGPKGADNVDPWRIVTDSFTGA